MAESFEVRLDQLIRSRTALIAIETAEERRAIDCIGTVANLKHHVGKRLVTWSRVRGLRQIAGPGVTPDSGNWQTAKPIAFQQTEDPDAALKHIASELAPSDNTRERPTIYVLCDFAPFLRSGGGAIDHVRVRRLRELAWQMETKRSTILVLGDHWPDIAALEHESCVLPLSLPDEQMVRRRVEVDYAALAERTGDASALAPDVLERLTQALLGLTSQEIVGIIARVSVIQSGISAASIPLILDAKKDAIRKSGALKWSDPEPLNALGGYGNLRRLLSDAAATFTDEARAFGITPHKGILLVGLPGCGKDLTKRVAASVLSRPLLDLDLGSVMGEGGGVIGSAERSIDRALALADVMRPVLGVSEFEKAVGGLASSGRTDGGTTARTIGKLLNWMQDQTHSFVLATANDVRQLAPEQTRQGRFGAIVFVDLPTYADRRDIARVHLVKIKRDPAAFDLDEIAEGTEGFSGAEIEGGVKSGLLTAFMDGRRTFTTADVITACRAIQPTSVVKREDIDDLRHWAREHMALGADAAVISDATLRDLEL